jgi:putative transposase
MGRNFIFSENEYYHVYNRGVEKRTIFQNKSDYKRFIALLLVANSDTPVDLNGCSNIPLSKLPRGNRLVDIGAWCLMPNHFHILIKEKQKDGISLFMKKLLTGYSMYFNIKYQRKGILFERPFRAKHLNTDNYLKYIYSYIHLNPIGIIDAGWKEKKIKDYKKTEDFLNSYEYSSFLDYLGKDRDEKLIINPEEFPEYFKSVNSFKETIKEWMNFTMENSPLVDKDSPCQPFVKY